MKPSASWLVVSIRANSVARSWICSFKNRRRTSSFLPISFKNRRRTSAFLPFTATVLSGLDWAWVYGLSLQNLQFYLQCIPPDRYVLARRFRVCNHGYCAFFHCCFIAHTTACADGLDVCVSIFSSSDDRMLSRYYWLLLFFDITAFFSGNRHTRSLTSATQCRKQVALDATFGRLWRWGSRPFPELGRWTAVPAIRWMSFCVRCESSK